ncbi:pathogenicity island protein [Lonsdalea quercina]|uniref:pathogenicity island protein n=1 Tax=Lonsdalea quercina TaxID=71657 RepID=UPI000479015C|nr:pathogenicity island protein [Lonsdalea quercina]
MLDKLKKIPLIDDVHISNHDGVILMNMEGRAARGYLCTLSLALSIYIDTVENFTAETANYMMLLLAACPQLHDYALQMNPVGGWLCGYYDKNMTAEIMAVEVEKHLALTRYLTSVLSCKIKSGKERGNEIK